MDCIHFLEWSTKLQEAPRSQTPWSMPSESLLSINLNQAETAWRAFKTWLPEHVTVLRKRHVLEFLVFLKRQQKAVVQNYLRLTDIPFLYPSRRVLISTLRTETSHCSLNPNFIFLLLFRRRYPKWSLDHALESLQTPKFRNNSASL